MVRLLVLRPEPGASATLALARELGIDAVASPLFTIESVQWEAPSPTDFDGLLLTSANAIRCGGEQLQVLRGLAAFAVGESTAAAAGEAGFDIAATGRAGIDGLLDSIEPGLRLLHLCGEDRRVPKGARQATTQIVVYRAKQIEQPDLPVTEESVALIHSPRAGRMFSKLVAERGKIAIAAISEAAAEASGQGWKSVDVADRPTDDALLALAARLCNNSSPK